MAAPAAAKRKRDFSEDDAYLILHKYTHATILTALQEVARHAGTKKIDWRALVANTATGITSAREYQMLWRYLAYGHDFVQNVDRSAQPLGDESDLECETEPFPTPSSETAAEASRLAKILIYGSTHEQASSHRVKSEVPVVNTANGKITRPPSDKQLGQSHRLTNGTGPGSISKQASHTGLSPDPSDGNGPLKKKRKPKPWSKEEDADLTTGVHKCGEGNWLDILNKYTFDNTRSAAELWQRWTLISERQGTTKPANAKPVSANFDITASQNTAYMFIDMPMGKPGVSTLRRTGPSQHHAPVFGTVTPDCKSAAHSSFPVPVAVPRPVPLQVQRPLPQVLKAPAQAAPVRVSNTSNKSRLNSKKQAAQINTSNAPSSIKAAAIAAGGRIATPSAATKLLKAAQSTKAVRVRSGGTGSSKTSASSKSSTMAGESGTQLGSAQHPEHTNCSAQRSSPLALTMQSTEQVNIVPEVEGVDSLEQFAREHLLENERRMSNTPLSGPCNNEMDDEVTMEDLFPEDVKQSDIVDPKAADILDQFDLYVESQKKQPKQLPAVQKSIPVSGREPTTVKKTKTLGSTFPPTTSGLVGTGNAGVLSKALGGRPSGPGTTSRQNGCQEILAQNQHATNSKGGNGMVKNAACAIGTPARNAAPSTGAPANRQYNPVVSRAIKGNPPPASK